MSTSASDVNENDDKEKVYPPVQAYAYLKSAKKKPFRVRSRPFSSRLESTALGGDAEDGAKKKQPLCQRERHPKATGGDNVADGQAEIKELEHGSIRVDHGSNISASQSGLHPVTPFFAGGIRGGEREGVYQEHGETHPHLKPSKKFCIWLRNCVFMMGCFCPFSCPTSGGEVGVDEAKKKVPLPQERPQEHRSNLIVLDDAVEDEAKKRQCPESHPKSIVGGDVADGREATKKALRLEPEQVPVVTPVNTKYRTDNSSNNIATFLQRSATAPSCCCRLLSRRLTSGDDSDHSYYYFDTQTPEQAPNGHFDVSLAKRNDIGGIDDVSTFGDQVGTASAQLIATVVQRTDAVAESVAPNSAEDSVGNGIEEANSAECPLEDSAEGVQYSITAEDIITLNIAGPGEPRHILGGLSRSGYKRIIFSDCPALAPFE